MPIEEKYEEATLLILLAQDSEYAFQLVFDRYRNKIYKVAMMYVKSPVIAEEVVQDIFMKLWFQRKQLENIKSLESWLYTLTKNLVLNYLKKLAHEWTVNNKWAKQLPVSASDTDHKIRTSQYSELISKAVSGLPEQQKKVYKLAKEAGLSYEEIGLRLSLSPLTVKTHMSRALESIRSFLKLNGEAVIAIVLFNTL